MYQFYSPSLILDSCSSRCAPTLLQSIPGYEEDYHVSNVQSYADAAAANAADRTAYEYVSEYGYAY